MPNTGKQTYETDRLILRPTAIEDATFFFKLFNTPKFLEYVGDRKVYSINDAETYIEEKIRPQFLRLGYSSFSVIQKSDQAIIGACGLYDRQGLEGVDLGFALLPDYEGKGYGFEAAQKVMELAFQNYGITKLKAITAPENIASQRLLKKIGFEYIEMIQIPNDPVELMLYELPSKISLPT